MPPLSFTPLTVADAPALASVARRAYCDHYLDYWHDGGAWYLQRSFTVEQLALELADPGARFFCVYRQEQAVGFLKVNLNKPLPEGAGLVGESTPGTGLELERIYLMKTATGQGIGEAAIRFVESLARVQQAAYIWLKAMDSSAAVGFYERMGFHCRGTQRLLFPQMKEERRGMVVLAKAL